MLLKTMPLVTGFALVGVGTISGYLWGSERDTYLTLSQILGALGLKVLSVAALIAWSWILARCVRPIRSFAAQLTLYGLGWIVSITVLCIALIIAANTSMDSWFIGVSDNYSGLPLYVTAIPVLIDKAPTIATATTIGLNVAVVLISLIIEAVHDRRFYNS
ncbi:hypothetical protein [Schaalia sp. lx-260]|uniref:hypothetical protein n=1 Tax=Schaalia sp. lx-260 TaxID=2899082 RepID=UPI001E38197E|nr:hypothetical protein [Schaalia sp. lx-260]MCD4548824.1 hypothetical protein [Schaalia sp. lx-260]